MLLPARSLTAAWRLQALSVINAKDILGKTALQWAIDRKHDAVAEVLGKAGAKE